eukprot:jgi/Hompol1/1580/HPOL_005245-RA
MNNLDLPSSSDPQNDTDSESRGVEATDEEVEGIIQMELDNIVSDNADASPNASMVNQASPTLEPSTTLEV